MALSGDVSEGGRPLISDMFVVVYLVARRERIGGSWDRQE